MMMKFVSGSQSPFKFFSAETSYNFYKYLIESESLVLEFYFGIRTSGTSTRSNPGSMI